MGFHPIAIHTSYYWLKKTYSNDWGKLILNNFICNQLRQLIATDFEALVRSDIFVHITAVSHKFVTLISRCIFH